MSGTIVVQGDPVREERTAGEAGIIPGHLLAVSSGEFIKHATADGITQKLFAQVNPRSDISLATAPIDTPYTDGDTVHALRAKPGDVIYAWLATGNNAVAGVSALVSAGTGALKVAAAVDATLIAGAQVAVPHESLNNTSGSNARLKVRIV